MRNRHGGPTLNELIAIPLWALLLLFLLAFLATLDRMLIPSVRWFFRRRINRAIDQLNQQLTVKLQPFKLTTRSVLIDRLIFDARGLEAVEQEADRTGAPREVVLDQVRAYAREIVPSFNAYLYFRLGYRFARSLARLLYRVRLGFSDTKALAAIDPNSTIVFVMNHRSNMDYVLVAFLAAEQTALSYAVGEWARVWPLHGLIGSMGAYFVRRDSSDPLYRRVLERYIQMATENGVTQAIYPEGGLSRDGGLRPPKLGILGYMLKEFEAERSRDIVLIPVGINYDRVLEDRSLVRDLDSDAESRSSWFALKTIGRFLLHNATQMLRRRWYRFGYACVNFGSPISLREYAQSQELSFSVLAQTDRSAFFEAVQELSAELMEDIGRAIPALPVAFIAQIFTESESAPALRLSKLEIKARAFALMETFDEGGGFVYTPRQDRDYAITVGLRMLTLRRILLEEEGLYFANPEDSALLAYYANSIVHRSSAQRSIDPSALRNRL